MQTSEVDLSLIERHFLALQISMESNDNEFNKLFSKGMVSEEIDKLRKASKNKFKSKDDGKRFTTDPKHDENIALATDLIKIVKKKKELSTKKAASINEKIEKGDTSSDSELLKYYEEPDKWKYRLLQKEFIRKQLSESTGKKDFFDIIQKIFKQKETSERANTGTTTASIEKSKDSTDYSSLTFTNATDVYKKINAENKYDNDMLDKSLTVHEFVKNLLELINISGGNEVEISQVKRLLKILKYVIQTTQAYYGEVNNINKQTGGADLSERLRDERLRDFRIHDINGLTRNMLVGIVSIPTLELIRTKLKTYIDSKTVSNDFRYKNVDRLIRCASRFSNSNSRLIIPLFITLNNNLLNEMFPKEDGKELSSDEITAILLNGESILQIIKSDRDRWLEIEGKFGVNVDGNKPPLFRRQDAMRINRGRENTERNIQEINTIANKTIIKNIDFLLTQLFANDGTLTGFFKSATGRQSSKKTLNYNGKTVNIEKYKWKNKQEFNSILKEKLEEKFKYLTNEENVKKMKNNTECITLITIGKKDEEKYKENKSLPNVIDLTPKVYLELYPSNCSKSELSNHKCKNRKNEIETLIQHYMDKAKGRKYSNENVDQLIEEKNNSKPLECKDDGSIGKNLKIIKDKPKDSNDKPKDSNDKPKDSNDKPKDNNDKPKDNNDKLRDKLKMNIKQIGGKKRNKKTRRKTKNLKKKTKQKKKYNTTRKIKLKIKRKTKKIVNIVKR